MADFGDSVGKFTLALLFLPLIWVFKLLFLFFKNTGLWIIFPYSMIFSVFRYEPIRTSADAFFEKLPFSENIERHFAETTGTGFAELGNADIAFFVGFFVVLYFPALIFIVAITTRSFIRLFKRNPRWTYRQWSKDRRGNLVSEKNLDDIVNITQNEHI
ncbi:MAG: hypothetical protein FWG24_06780 [Eggerthellaceae bacterium]|nr:hypothetical protein [Eggerthellaceae bacterium]